MKLMLDRDLFRDLPDSIADQNINIRLKEHFLSYRRKLHVLIKGEAQGPDDDLTGFTSACDEPLGFGVLLSSAKASGLIRSSEPWVIQAIWRAVPSSSPAFTFGC